MAFEVKPFHSIKCPNDDCYFSITFASSLILQEVLNEMCYHYANHSEPIDDEADCG